MDETKANYAFRWLDFYVPSLSQCLHIDARDFLSTLRDLANITGFLGFIVHFTVVKCVAQTIYLVFPVNGIILYRLFVFSLFFSLFRWLFSLHVGLDPAFPLYMFVDPLSRLSADAADFVDIIHTDGGVLGYPSKYLNWEILWETPY